MTNTDIQSYSVMMTSILVALKSYSVMMTSIQVALKTMSFRVICRDDKYMGDTEDDDIQNYSVMMTSGLMVLKTMTFRETMIAMR